MLSFSFIAVVIFVYVGSFGRLTTSADSEQKAPHCQKVMAYGWGDAVDPQIRCTVDPAGKPINAIAMRLLSSTISGAGRFIKVRARSDEPSTPTAPATGTPRRDGRMLATRAELFDDLLSRTKFLNGESMPSAMGRTDAATGVCSEGCDANRLMPESCCEVRTEVAYPQFGQSAISEETFTIIQDFPDFVQPVFKRVCVTNQCNLVLGNCTQKYVPHAVFSAPSGKFGNLFGQDYLLVESGCECSPYSRPAATKYLPPQPTTSPKSPIIASLDGITIKANVNKNTV